MWNMAPIRNESDESNHSVPKSLCEMSNHLGCVNSVRWSIDGKWLASGGDDAIVMIWQIKYQGVSKSSFGGTTHEQWGCLHMLRGHNGDILGVNWSLDQKYLASCSVDNTIIIWNAKDLPQKVSSIAGHQGLVKGVTWDPVGKYIASQSDDRSVRIWRTSDWKEVKQVTKPFKKCGGTTHVLRLSWSPDGKFIVSAHALNNDGPIAQIIEREDWKTGIDFVGHRKAIEVVSFNPHLFVKNGGLDNHGCVALGSRDRSLSVWLTNHKRPLLVTHDLFTDSILDLSWSKDGYELMVCSTDGSIAYLGFTEKELGKQISEQALDDIFVATYGSKRTSKSGHNTSTILIEDPEMLKLHSSAKQQPMIKGAITSTPVKTDGKEGAVSDINLANQSMEMVSTSSSVPTVTKQLEVKTKDGRRRITPITLTTQPCSLSGAPLPFTSFSPKQNKGVTVDPKTPEQNLSKKSSTESVSVAKDVDMLSLVKSPPPKPMHFEPLSARKEAPNVEKKGSSSEISKSTSQKRPLETTVTNLPKAKKLKRSKGPETLTDASGSSGGTKPSTPQKASNLVNFHKQNQILLPVPELVSTLTVMASVGVQEHDSLTIELENNLSSSQAVIACRRGETALWFNTLTSPGLLVSGNHFVTCVVCNDKGVYVFSTQSGRLLLAKFFIPSLPHTLVTEFHFVMLVSSNADVFVWDTRTLQATVKQVSISHLLQDGKKILKLESILLTTNGLPVIAVKGTSYMYHKDMAVWIVVGSSSEESEISSPAFSVSSAIDVSTPLRQIQGASSGTSKRTDSIGQMLTSIRTRSSQSNTLTYLESQISRSVCLQSPFEYSHWSKAYVRYLVKESHEARLREFCVQFTSPLKSGEEMVLGFRKESLLRLFLAIIAGNAKLQRLYCELRDTIER